MRQFLKKVGSSFKSCPEFLNVQRAEMLCEFCRNALVFHFRKRSFNFFLAEMHSRQCVFNLRCQLGIETIGIDFRFANNAVARIKINLSISERKTLVGFKSNCGVFRNATPMRQAFRAFPQLPQAPFRQKHTHSPRRILQ